MKNWILCLLIFPAFSTLAKDLDCKCNDESTATNYEYDFHFLTDDTVKADLKSTEGSSPTKDICQQRKSDFEVKKVDGQIELTGKMDCDDEKGKELVIHFDPKTMTLPEDVCHEDTAFKCTWKEEASNPQPNTQ